MKHIKVQSMPSLASIDKLDPVVVDLCEGRVGLDLWKCRKNLVD
jgi:hypothetical protein